LRQGKDCQHVHLVESENKTAKSLEENENKGNEDVDEFREQLIINSNSLVFFWPYNKSFIDQARSVKFARYWLCSFLCKMNFVQFPIILTSRLVNNAHLLLHHDEQ